MARAAAGPEAEPAHEAPSCTVSYLLQHEQRCSLCRALNSSPHLSCFEVREECRSGVGKVHIQHRRSKYEDSGTGQDSGDPALLQHWRRGSTGAY